MDLARSNAIVSIGPQTDSILDELDIEDRIIPYLRFLLRSTWSSCWAVELQRSQWGFNHEDAVKIAEAMLNDVCREQIIVVKVCHCCPISFNANFAKQAGYCGQTHSFLRSSFSNPLTFPVSTVICEPLYRTIQNTSEIEPRAHKL